MTENVLNSRKFINAWKIEALSIANKNTHKNARRIEEIITVFITK